MNCPAFSPAVRSSARPEWITDQLIAETIAVWSPYYDHELTTAEALEILTNMGRILDAIQEPTP